MMDRKDNFDAMYNSVPLQGLAVPPAMAGYYGFPYDGSMNPFANYAMELNGTRRKNATRESTVTLKNWLHSHRKNPYPSKTDKLLLAVMTQMTLTQVRKTNQYLHIRN